MQPTKSTKISTTPSKATFSPELEARKKQFRAAMAEGIRNLGPKTSSTTSEGIASLQVSQPRQETSREALMEEILADRPGLTREKLSKQMESMGY
jgi:hypothetical protein